MGDGDLRDRLTKDTFGDLPVTACTTSLLTVTDHIFRSARLVPKGFDVRVHTFGYIIMYNKAHYKKKLAGRVA